MRRFKLTKVKRTNENIILYKDRDSDIIYDILLIKDLFKKSIKNFSCCKSFEEYLKRLEEGDYLLTYGILGD